MRMYSIDRMLNRYDFQFWNVGLLFREVYTTSDVIEGDYIRQVMDLTVFKSMLDELDDSTIIFTDIPQNYIFRTFFKILKRYNFVLINLDLVTIGPKDEAKKPIILRLINKFTYNYIKTTFK